MEMNSFSSIYHHAVNHPVWSFKLFFIYLGNPFVFAFYFPMAQALQKVIPSLAVTTKVDYNTDRISPLLFLLLTLPIYILWVIAQVALFLRMKPNFQLSVLLDRMVSNTSLIFAFPGAFNIGVWVGSGMEGNIMGFIFALPLLICAVVYVILWIVSVWAAWSTEAQASSDPLVAKPVEVGPDQGSLT